MVLSTTPSKTRSSLTSCDRELRELFAGKASGLEKDLVSKRIELLKNIYYSEAQFRKIAKLGFLHCSHKIYCTPYLKRYRKILAV